MTQNIQAENPVSEALEEAIELLGLGPLAALLGVSYQAVRKWQRAGRMPRTEWTGETDYAARIETATGRKVTRDRLLTVVKGRAA